jgi:endonuclease/exonuclease/phosphatase family metal-dependent hydrolase
VLGDFNATIGEEVLELLAGHGLRNALPNNAAGTAHDFTGQMNGRRIDHVLVSAAIAVRGASIVTSTTRRLPSDHWPVVADLTLDGERS